MTFCAHFSTLLSISGGNTGGIKKRPRTGRRRFSSFRSINRLDGTGNLAGAEAPSTYVDMAGSTVDQSLHTTNVRLPSSVGTTMRVRDLDTKGHALAANIALCHFPAPPSLVHCITDIIIPQQRGKCKLFFYKNNTFSSFDAVPSETVEKWGKRGYNTIILSPAIAEGSLVYAVKRVWRQSWGSHSGI